jgi:SAM-dependent methyltransferase
VRGGRAAYPAFDLESDENPPVQDLPSDLTPFAVAPDGSPVLVYRRLPPGDEPEVIRSAVPSGAHILELGAGAGRITHPLVALGYHVVAVDASAEMLHWIRDAETVQARIEQLDLGRRFDAVLLGSHLVNVPDDDLRRAFLATCRMHVADTGVVLIEHHDPDWAQTAAASRIKVGTVLLGLTNVRRHPPFVSATGVYEVEGHAFRQPFTARVLSIGEIADELARVGLRLRRRLTDGWAEAVPIGRRSSGRQGPSAQDLRASRVG